MIKAGEIVYLKAAPEITGTLCYVRDGRFTVSYPPSHGAKHGQRYSYPCTELHRFERLALQPRLKFGKDHKYEDQE